MPQSRQALTMQSAARRAGKLSDQTQDTSGSFVRLAFHSSTVVGNTLFIDGGEITLSTDNTLTTATQNKTLTIALSSSWETSQVEFNSIDKDISVPILNFGASWTSSDQNSMFSFGGVRSSLPYSPIIGNIEIWEYSTANGWSGLTSQSSVSPSLTNNRPAFAASTYRKGIGYMLGGIRGNDNAPWSPLSGLLTYNMAENTWTNESTISAVPYSTIGGSLTFVPVFGKEGILLAMGGEYAGSKSWMEMATNFVPFTNISIWDIASKTWYWQNTTARSSVDTPPSAVGFCSAGVAGQNGTYEVFIYGGHDDTFVLSSKTPSDADRAAQGIFNAVYVLSLPGFLWSRVSTDTATARTGHTCEIIGNRQMLSVGGLNPTYKLEDARDLPDDFSQGLGVFDMVDLQWVSLYNASAAEYVTPGIVQDWYDAQGLESLVWSSAGIEALFNHSTNDTTPQPSMPSGPTTNVIVPAAIGAIFGVIILAALVACLYRHYFARRGQDSVNPSSEGDQRDTLANNLRTYLTRTKDRYLTERRAFIRRTTTESHTSKENSEVSASPMRNHEVPALQITLPGSFGRPNPEQTFRIYNTDRPPPLSSIQYPNHPAFSHTGSDATNHPEESRHHVRIQPPDLLVGSKTHQTRRSSDVVHTRAGSTNQALQSDKNAHKVVNTEDLHATTRMTGVEKQGIPYQSPTSQSPPKVRASSNGNRHRAINQHYDPALQEME